jgi:hypothetical protein
MIALGFFLAIYSELFVVANAINVVVVPIIIAFIVFSLPLELYVFALFIHSYLIILVSTLVS